MKSKRIRQREQKKRQNKNKKASVKTGFLYLLLCVDDDIIRLKIKEAKEKMGLDMYMHKYEECRETGKVCYKRRVEEVGYWGKAYPIASLFKEHFKEMETAEWERDTYKVTKESLKDVAVVLKETLLHNKLPTCFIEYRDKFPYSNSSEQRLFDDNGEYNNKFYSMVEDALFQIEGILTRTDFNGEVIVYSESW